MDSEQLHEFYLKVIMVASIKAANETEARDTLGLVVNRAISTGGKDVLFTAYRIVPIESEA